MNLHDKEMLDRLNKMSLSEARMAIARGEFGAPPDSHNYLFASGIVAARESAERDLRELEAPRFNRHIMAAAYVAAIAATIGAIPVIISYARSIISWLQSL